MTLRRADQASITIRVMTFPIFGWGIAILPLVIFVWGETLVHAEEPSTGMSHSTEMIGKLVKNIDGKNVGKIKDFVMNWRRGGYIEYAVLSLGGFWGLEDECVAVPWEALTRSDNKEYFVLNMKEEHLKDAPGFVVHRFYDRSSVAVHRGARSTAASSTQVPKGGVGSDVNVSVAKSFSMLYAMEADFHR